MNAEMKEAEKHLTGMEKWCGLCICPWNRRPKVRDIDGTWQSNKVSLILCLQSTQVYPIPPFTRPTRHTQTHHTYIHIKLQSGDAVKGQPATKNNGAVPDGGGSGGNQQYVRRINNDAREDEMEDNMQAVGGILGNLKNMASDMGEEIEKQNKQLDRINEKVIVVFLLLFFYILVIFI